MAKARYSQFDCSPGCAVEAAIGLIDGKWKSVILFHLMSGTLRFNEIRRHIGNVTPRMLTNQLRELEQDGLVDRKVYAQVPPKVGIQPLAARAQHGADPAGAEGMGRRQYRPLRQAERLRSARGGR